MSHPVTPIASSLYPHMFKLFCAGHTEATKSIEGKNIDLLSYDKPYIFLVFAACQDLTWKSKTAYKPRSFAKALECCGQFIRLKPCGKFNGIWNHCLYICF